MKLIDLMCAAGGCTRGYQIAGFTVHGVDVNAHPNYVGDSFTQGDVLKLDPAWIAENFDAIHASPPCQSYMRGGLATGEHPDLLGPTRELLEQTGLPWVIENVPGAPMRPDVVLCGSQFGLPIRRHRWFETNWSGPVMTLSCDHSRPITGVYGNPSGKRGAWPGMLPDGLAEWSRALGIDWMSTAELALAIPPAYTTFIGEHLIRHLSTERVSARVSRNRASEPVCPVVPVSSSSRSSS